MSYVNRTVIQQLESRDGRFRVSIFKRPEGLFQFEGEELIEEDEFPGSYWLPRYVSGLHETQAAAEREARVVLPWLKSEITG